MNACQQSRTYGKIPFRSAHNGNVYTTDNSAADSNGQVTSVHFTNLACLENPSCDCSPGETGDGFKMVLTSMTGIGLPSTIALPLQLPSTSNPSYAIDMIVKDSLGHKLGILQYLGLSATGDVTVLTSTGYLVNIVPHTSNLDYSQMYWSGSGCTGVAWLNDGGESGQVLYGKSAWLSLNGNVYTISPAVVDSTTGFSTSGTQAYTSSTIENFGVPC